jgi:hypothetical protein
MVSQTFYRLTAKWNFQIIYKWQCFLGSSNEHVIFDSRWLSGIKLYSSQWMEQHNNNTRLSTKKKKKSGSEYNNFFAKPPKNVRVATNY